MDETLLLIEREIPRLRRYARYLARDIDKADDLVQEALTRAITKIHTWQPGTNLRAWLFVILKNVFINEIRRNQRSTSAGQLWPDHPALAVAGGQEAHIALLDTQQAFNRLPEEQREVLLLVVVEGLSYEEAAAIGDVPVGTIRSRLSRARRALKQLTNGEMNPRARIAP